MKRLLLVLVLISSLAWSQTTAGYFYSHLTQATANNPLSVNPALLHTIVVNSTTSGTIVVKDTLAADCSGGTAVTGTVTPAANTTLTYDVTMAKGLCITTGGTIDITVSWRY
jgi:hypothetical protein